VDAILVATPNACHCEDTLLALRHGKPVLCEKPMATSVGECAHMIAAAGKAGRLLGVAQVFRFHHTVIRMRERVAAGEIGQPIWARAEFCFPGKTARSWLYDRALGGGALADVGVHCVDALRFILQDEVVGVDARAVFDAKSGEVEASAGMLVQFARSTLGSILASYRSPYRTVIEIVGATGTLRAIPAFSVEEPVRTELWREGEPVDTERVTSADCFSRMIDAFALAVEDKQPFLCPGEEGLKNQIALDEAYAKLSRTRVADR
jgi:1,5-anhydro-D-fructose reductase (1,5-anhydro-D-mannitol-forming)